MSVGSLGLELVLILLLVVANGVLAMGEIALVSSRPARLRSRAERGDAGARTALDLLASPNEFLSTVQVGITLVGTLAGAFGGATVAEPLATALHGLGLTLKTAEGIALGLVVGGITVLSVVLGELVPKRIALRAPEKVASLLSRPLHLLSRLTAPLVRLLARATGAVVGAFGLKGGGEPEVTEDEIRLLVRQGRDAGVLLKEEEAMLSGVLALGDRTAGSVMTPRPLVATLDANADPAVTMKRVAETRHSYYPVFDGTEDNLVGMVSVKDLWSQLAGGSPLDLKAAVEPALHLLSAKKILDVLDEMRRERTHVALVIDEYGVVEGLLKLSDILETVSGEIPEAGDGDEPGAVQREDGSWLLDGLLPVDEAKAALGLARLPGEETGAFRSLGGFVISRLGRVPRAADRFDWNGLRFEVVDMDGVRVDKVLVGPAPR